MVVELAKYWWQDASCLVTTVASKKVAPICQHERIVQFPSTLPTLPMSTTTAVCPDGWSEFEGHCYLCEGTGLTWLNAEQNCLNMGGHLASIHSKAERDFVSSIFVSYWVGASDTVTEVHLYNK